MLYNNIEKNMRSNKISFAHKNRLILFTKISRENEEKPANLQLCSTSIAIPKELQRHSFNSREKQNRKLIVNQNFQTVDRKQGNSLKLRSFSTNLDVKALSNLSNMQLRKKQLQLLQSNKTGTLQRKITQLVDELKKKFIIFQNHLTSYTIKKDHFYHLLYYLANTANNNNQQLEDDFASLSKVFDQIAAQICISKHDASKQKLCIKSQTIHHTISRNDYLQQTLIKMSQIQKLNRSRDSLLEELRNIEKFKTNIVKQVQQKQEQINQELKTIQKNSSVINASQRQLENVKKQLKDYNDEIAKVKEVSDKINRYVGTQANKLIAMASQQYKNIESEIYEYASYLQCNQLASSLDYQPLSITCLTENLEEQLKTINRTLIQNEEIGAKEKGKLMRDFLLQWMNRYKKKDDEQKDLLAFKTKCVQNFIEKMKKWLDNWTLKQEYLVGLRDQFALDTVQINSRLKQASTHSFCDSCSKIKPIITSITEAYGKIENNYKMGNSFY